MFWRSSASRQLSSHSTWASVILDFDARESPPPLPTTNKHVRANYLVIGRPGGSLDALVAAEEEVVLSGMGDVGIHSCPRWHIAGSSRLVALVHAEESRVMTLLHGDQRDPWHVVRFKLQKRNWDRAEVSLKLFEGPTLTQASRIARSSTWSTLLNCPSHTPSLRRRISIQHISVCFISIFLFICLLVCLFVVCFFYCMFVCLFVFFSSEKILRPPAPLQQFGGPSFFW